jgi:hypothetical protein
LFRICFTQLFSYSASWTSLCSSLCFAFILLSYSASSAEHYCPSTLPYTLSFVFVLLSYSAIQHREQVFVRLFVSPLFYSVIQHRQQNITVHTHFLFLFIPSLSTQLFSIVSKPLFVSLFRFCSLNHSPSPFFLSSFHLCPLNYSASSASICSSLCSTLVHSVI